MARGGRGKRKEARKAAEEALESGSVVLPESSLEAWSVPPSVANPVNWREVKYNPDKSDYYSDYGTVLRDPSEPAVTPEEAALQRSAWQFPRLYRVAIRIRSNARNDDLFNRIIKNWLNIRIGFRIGIVVKVILEIDVFIVLI